MSERGPDPVASAMAGALLGIGNELAASRRRVRGEVCRRVLAGVRRSEGRVGSNVAGALREESRVLFHVFSKREIERSVDVTEVDDSSEKPVAAGAAMGTLLPLHDSRAIGWAIV